jgi:hypothetical protein
MNRISRRFDESFIFFRNSIFQNTVRRWRIKSENLETFLKKEFDGSNCRPDLVSSDGSFRFPVGNFLNEETKLGPFHAKGTSP